MMKYEAVIFDLDGTLWKANESCTKAWNILLDRLNFNERVTVQAMDKVTGKPMDDCIDTLMPGIRKKHNNIKSLLVDMEKEVVGHDGASIYPDVLSKIRELSGCLKLFIVSNCEKWYLDKFIEYSGLGNNFTECDCYGISNLKKHQMISNITKKYKLERAVYIGDTLHDKESAELSGTDFIQVTYGFGDPIINALRFDSFNDLFNYLITGSEISSGKGKREP